MADADGAPGPGVSLAASLEAGLGKISDSLERWTRRTEAMQAMWQDVHPAPLQQQQISLSAGAGTLNPADIYGPQDGLYWDVRRLTVWGFTAGTITVYLNSTSGEQLAQTTVAGQFTWSGQVILGPNDKLVVGATGVTGSVYVAGQVIEIDARTLPQYLI